MANRSYTILIIPETTSQVRRLVLPSWVVRAAGLILGFAVLLTAVMVFDYWYVMNQIGENKQLKLENRKLRQQVQIFQNKISTVESTMERVKSFATRLRVIMNVEDQKPDLQTISSADGGSARLASLNSGFSSAVALGGPTLGPAPAPGSTEYKAAEEAVDPEKIELRKEYTLLENKIFDLNQNAFNIEELLQDEYEILYDKKAFLSALPTRMPAMGYFTSGFGVRISPFGDRVKMHEGLDIANRMGTPIRATADGEVVFENPKAGYGLTLILNHGYGIETWYGHLKGFVAKKGEKVKRGTKIAYLGNSGLSTGPHVHYEVRVHGYPVDPRSYIFEDSSP